MSGPNWIVVADRREARFFHHVSSGARLTEAGPGVLAFEAAVGAADRPGRVHERVGAGRHGVESTAPLAETERERAGRAIADALNRAENEGAFAQVVVVATPKLLGAIRVHLREAVRRKLVGEIHRRLIDATPAELADRLTEAGFVGEVSR